MHSSLSRDNRTRWYSAVLPFDRDIIVSFAVAANRCERLLLRFKSNGKIRIMRRESHVLLTDRRNVVTWRRAAFQPESSFPLDLAAVYTPEGAWLLEVEEFNNGRGRVARRRARSSEERSAPCWWPARRLRSFIGILQVVRQVWPAFVMGETWRWAIHRERERGSGRGREERYPSLLSSWSAADRITDEFRRRRAYLRIPIRLRISIHLSAVDAIDRRRPMRVSPPAPADRFRPDRGFSAPLLWHTRVERSDAGGFAGAEARSRSWERERHGRPTMRISGESNKIIASYGLRPYMWTIRTALMEKSVTIWKWRPIFLVRSLARSLAQRYVRQPNSEFRSLNIKIARYEVRQACLEASVRAQSTVSIFCTSIDVEEDIRSIEFPTTTNDTF